MCIMASGIVRGRARTTTTAVESCNMAAMLQLIGCKNMHPPSVLEVCHLFLAGFSKEKKNSSLSANYTGGCFDVFNKGCTKAIREQEFTTKEVAKVSGPALGKNAKQY